MNPVQALILYIVLIFGGGAILAPWLFTAVQWAAEFSPVIQPLAAKPFHRFVSRSLLILAIAGLWPFLRLIGTRSWRDVGIRRTPSEWKYVSQGLFWGFASLAVIVVIVLSWDVRTFTDHHTGLRIVEHLRNAGLAAITVSILEEILFRGAIFGSLRKVFSWQTALFVSSLIYASVHFLGRPEPVPSVEWTSGFIALGAMVQDFATVDKLIPGLFNLTLAGAILGYAYQQTGTLHFSIGLHAGWIFWLKSYSFLFVEPSPSQPWFWGTNKLIDGCLATLLLLVLFVFLMNRGFAVDESTRNSVSKPV